MQVIHTLAELQRHLEPYRRPAVVPTMGSLHAGHLALVERAKSLGDITVATIFVNRLQFGPQEDFDAYPRSLEADCEKLRNCGCDMVFAPSETEFYPQAQTFRVQPPPDLADILEGHFRPGFFSGVCTVVLKLLACTRARSAVFGKKDYQQWLVIGQMVRQFALAVDIVGVETCRDADGLAMSSRNAYLDPRERAQAVELSATLGAVATALRAGASDWEALQTQAMQRLERSGWRADYVAVRCRDSLDQPQTGRALVVLGAARLGRTRLIDNLEV
jgi:pantoate--beta-alanine ligase